MQDYNDLANYLSLSLLYLDVNPFLKQKIDEKDLKDVVVGHWGAVPGLNFIFTHIFSFIKKTKASSLFVCGTGHGVASIVANLYLDGSISKSFPQKYPFNHYGLGNLIRDFGKNEILQTEANPRLPSVIHQGGELGYSLAIAFGVSLNFFEGYVFAILGDGEAETGTLSASFYLPLLFHNTPHGKIVAILNLNGNKMKSPSLLSNMPNEDLINFFSAQGFSVYLVDGLNHSEMEKAFLCIDVNYQNDSESTFFPLVILKSPKGFSGPEFINGLPFAGTYRSHKAPASSVFESNMCILNGWFERYCIQEKIKGAWFSSEVLSVLPSENHRLGNQYQLLSNKNKQKRIVVSFDSLEIPVYSDDSPMKTLDAALVQFSDSYKLVVLSPDEAESNNLDKVSRTFARVTGSQRQCIDESHSLLIEILNENICQGLLEGLALTGGLGIFVSYEAFLPIVTSMLVQFMKYMEQSPNGFVSPITLISTSLGWRNTFSHQQPSIYADFLMKGFDFVHVFFPIDSNSLLAIMEKSLTSNNTINLIATTKTTIKTRLSLKESRICVNEGLYVKDYFYGQKEPEVVICSIGDIAVQESFYAADYLKGIGIRLVAISDLSLFDQTASSAYSMEQWEKVFTPDKPVIFTFIGYTSLLKSLFFGYINFTRASFFGYDNACPSANQFYLLLEKGISRYCLILEVLKKVRPKSMLINELDESISKLCSEKGHKITTAEYQRILCNDDRQN